MKERLFTALVAVAASAVSAQEVENVPELDLSSDVTITVPDGSIKRIEYISGKANANLIKDGGGTLEVAIVGNTNASFFVNGGKLKFVRPGKLALATDEAAFHVDGSDMDSMEISVENGTNFVTKMKDVMGRSTYASQLNSRPNPFLSLNALNGLSVFDFGGMYGNGLVGHGAAMGLSEHHFPNEIFYVWTDYDEDKWTAEPGKYGPTPVNMWYSGYRGSNTTVGAGWKLFRTATRITENLYLDDVKAGAETIPGDGWHLFRTYTSKFWDPSTESDDNKGNYRVRGFGFKPGGTTPCGGFKLAEMVLCTNYLTTAKREYVNFYLKRKWFGGYPVKRVVLSEGSMLDASEASLPISDFQMTGAASVVGLENISMVTPSGASSNVVVSAGVYNAKDRNVSAIPNLGFAADGEIVLPVGTNAANIVDGVGRFRKSGAGALSISYLGSGFESLDVASGSLVINPLLTPSASLHVDAADSEAFVISQENGTNFVVRWEDVLRCGQALVQSNAKYSYNDNAVVNRPFRVPNRQNGLPMVDFGTQADADHPDGWGAMLAVLKPITVKNGSRLTSSDYGALQVFTVWEDDPASFEREYLKDAEGVLKPVIGPSIYGNGYSWYRGAGGEGVGFPFCTMQGPATVREEMWLDNKRFYSQYVRFTPIDMGVHLMDQRIGDGEGGSSIAFVGGNATCQTTNGPYAAKGMYGGVRIGESMAFRYALPMAQRTQIRNALGVKWFGTEKYSHCYGFENITISQGASLSLPYAEVSVTNLTVGGNLSSRTISVSKALAVTGDSTVSAPLSLKSGGTFTIVRNDAGDFFELEVDAFSIESKGLIEISDWDGLLCGESYRVVESESLSGDASGWSGRNADGMVKARFEMRSDGLYLKFESCGTRIIIR